MIPLQPWAIRGFSNEESIHTAPIQLTLSANPLHSSVPLCARPARSSPLSSFLLYPAVPLLSVRESPSGLSSAREQRRRNLFYAPERAGTCPRPPPYFSPPFLRSPFQSTYIHTRTDSLFIKMKIRIFQNSLSRNDSRRILFKRFLIWISFETIDRWWDERRYCYS